jgi:hypothetical protein
MREGLTLAILFELWKSKHSQTGNSHLRTNVLLTIIMSNERPSDHTRIRRIAGSFNLKGKLSSPLHLSRAPTPSSIDKDSSSDNSTK